MAKILPIKLVILDRDGVINWDSLDYIKSPAEWHAIPGSLEAISRLNQANIQIGLATNQSGIARGLYTEAILHAIHQKMQAELKKAGGHLDTLFFCPHHPDHHCECRKPKPGMLLNILNTFNIPPAAAVMIGDKKSDMAAAAAAGVGGVFIGSGGYPNLAQAVTAILTHDLRTYLPS